jgi:hypothetical protein
MVTWGRKATGPEKDGRVSEKRALTIKKRPSNETQMKGVIFFMLSLHIENYIVQFKSWLRPATASATGSTGSRLGRLGFGAIAGIEPAVTLKAECRCGNEFFHRSTTLGAFTGRGIGKFLAQFKLVVTS